ncbi:MULTISPECIES: hypothetical protein [unclassified Bacillus (in: firmicutes)]|uniref:hypothetical protein n=1 Tax=unclassified Bacillus (in: firmicutes) TaxID=185979 RepID=UPI0008E4CD91|nr:MULTISPECIES: hypothetical protein [unclassified Bacillus (in: firmicutes)]SFA80667.1 zinc transporter, ZIP family [Bacillus sp. UNCCL13]SFQ70786.1 zinc transporter, ZIP family [Bacillus sp. cl95]
MVEELEFSAAIVFLVFVGMVIGGTSIRIMGVFISRENTVYLQILCGGLLMGLFTFEILPKAFIHYQSVGIFTGISIGVFIMLSMEWVLHKSSHFHTLSQDALYLLMVALIIHSFPTGIMFGMSLQKGALINGGLLLAFIIHHVPEGMIIMSLVPMTKRKNRLFILLCSTLSIVIGLNIYMGLHISFDSMKWNTIMMGTTIGTLGYVTIYEMLWKKSKNLSKGKVALIVLTGMMGIHYFLKLLPTHH